MLPGIAEHRPQAFVGLQSLVGELKSALPAADVGVASDEGQQFRGMVGRFTRGEGLVAQPGDALPIAHLAGQVGGFEIVAPGFDAGSAENLFGQRSWSLVRQDESRVGKRPDSFQGSCQAGKILVIFRVDDLQTGRGCVVEDERLPDGAGEGVETIIPFQRSIWGQGRKLIPKAGEIEQVDRHLPAREIRRVDPVERSGQGIVGGDLLGDFFGQEGRAGFQRGDTPDQLLEESDLVLPVAVVGVGVADLDADPQPDERGDQQQAGGTRATTASKPPSTSAASLRSSKNRGRQDTGQEGWLSVVPLFIPKDDMKKRTTAKVTI